MFVSRFHGVLEISFGGPLLPAPRTITPEVPWLMKHAASCDGWCSGRRWLRAKFPVEETGAQKLVDL